MKFSSDKRTVGSDEAAQPVDPLLLLLAEVLPEEERLPLSCGALTDAGSGIQTGASMDAEAQMKTDPDAGAAGDSPFEGDQVAEAHRRTPRQIVDAVVAKRNARAQWAASTDSVLESQSQLASKRDWAGGPPEPLVDVDPAFVHLAASHYLVASAEEIEIPSRYRKLDFLGRGGQGVVYLTECVNDFGGRQALKIFSPGPYRKQDAAAYHEDMERQQRMASLIHDIEHVNLLGVQQFVKHRNIFMMVMPWINGFDLEKLRQLKLFKHLCARFDAIPDWQEVKKVVYGASGPRWACLTPGIAMCFVERCLRGLDALHDEGIVHGDIKPSNIMMDRHGNVRLVDLGSAAKIGAPPKYRTLTPYYAPPEYHRDGIWTPQSDLASLGYVLIELLSGQPLFNNSVDPDESVCAQDYKCDTSLLEQKMDLPKRLPDLLPARDRDSLKLVGICKRLIAPDLADRFRSANEAIVSEVGTFGFHTELTLARLVVYNASVMNRWVWYIKSLKEGEQPALANV